MTPVPHQLLSSSTDPKLCHPERSLVESEANRQTQSKDLVHAGIATGTARDFRIVIRFFDEHGGELRHLPSREAPTECNLRCTPDGAKETTASTPQRRDNQRR